MNIYMKVFYFNIILVACFGLFLKIEYKKIIGWFGELWVKKELKKLPKDKYRILNNIMIEVNSKTYQIDHIVFSEYGIFVIETKQYNGYFTGDKYDKKWVKHYSNGEKYYYENPIRQNYGHVKAICELLDLDENKVFNIVCIPSTAKLNITHDGELTTNLNIIDKITSYKNSIIENVEEYYKKIKKRNISSKKEIKKHINNIKKNNIQFDKTMCPKCGGKLVERESKYGLFIGCSNYPKCRYTEKYKI